MRCGQGEKGVLKRTRGLYTAAFAVLCTGVSVRGGALDLEGADREYARAAGRADSAALSLDLRIGEDFGGSSVQ
jgi:hypothetical protein